MIFPESWQPRLLSVLRIAAAVLLIPHGTQKLHAYPVIEGSGAVPWGSMFGIAGFLELYLGVLLLLGVWTRPVALILSGELAVAYWRVHAGRDPWPLRNGGELAALYSFLFLYIASVGGGSWSLDALLARRKTR